MAAVKAAPQFFELEVLDMMCGIEHDEAMQQPNNVLRKEQKQARRALAKERSLRRPGWDLEKEAALEVPDPASQRAGLFWVQEQCLARCLDLAAQAAAE